MSRARRAADLAVAYGAIRAAIVVLDDVWEGQPLGAHYQDVPEVHQALIDARAAHVRLRGARDRLYSQIQRDVDPLERLELELDRATDE